MKPANRGRLPRSISLRADGTEGDGGSLFTVVPVPFRFCLRCGVTYGSSRLGDYTKLATLATEGRSTATTILSLSAVRHLRRDNTLPADARKLLSFTDNRQDASLQAGHFNDFVEVGLLRSALYKAVQAAGPGGLPHDGLEQAIFAALLNMGVTDEHYAREPGLLYAAAEQTNAALRSVLSYRIYRDQERGWRITAPNLEQCGLLMVDYLSLMEICADKQIWKDVHETLADASPADRERVSRTLLNFMRQELAIRVDALDPEAQERMKQRSDQRLVPPWGIDENENLEHSRILFPRSRRAHDAPESVFLSSRSGFGQYLRRSGTFAGLHRKISVLETGTIIKDLLEVLRKGGLVERIREDDEAPGYQLPAAALIWKAR